MLVIKNEVDFPHFKYLVNEFRRVQVSRFPIEVVVSNEGMVIGFVDSRFPTDRFNVSNMLAMLYVESNTNEKPTITIESRLINNEKFARHNDKFCTRSTHDLKKMFKYMKEYIKPFSGQEIAQKSYRGVQHEFETWQRKAHWGVKEALNQLEPKDFMEGIAKLQALGIEPPTEKFAELAKTAIPHFEEMKRRDAMEEPNYHIAINPDDSVVVTIMRGNDKGSSIKESLDACPLFIQQNVGMLKMVNDNERIPEVGTKVNTTQFWIEGKPQE
jgi:hypothetical protein